MRLADNNLKNLAMARRTEPCPETPPLPLTLTLTLPLALRLPLPLPLPLPPPLPPPLPLDPTPHQARYPDTPFIMYIAKSAALLERMAATGMLG